MDIPKVIRRLFGLNNLATGQAGTPEGDNAQRMMDTMLEKHDLNIPEGALAEGEARVPMEHDYDRDLARLISKATHTTVHIFKDANEMKFSGIQVAVDEAVKHYETQREKLERLTGYTILGYLMGAFGNDAVGELMAEAKDLSKTVQAGQKEAEDRAKKAQAFEEDPTKTEGGLITAAAEIGLEDPVTYWDRLKGPSA